MSVTVYEDDHKKEISQSDGFRKVIIKISHARENTVINSGIPRMTMRCPHRCAREQRFHPEHDYSALQAEQLKF